MPACITCPCCQLTSYNPNDAKHLFCGRCHWWTSDPELAPYHFALPCEHRGQGVIVPRLGDWYRETHIIFRSDPGPFEYQMPPAPGGPWLHTQPGTMFEIAGHIRGQRRRWGSWLKWKKHLRAARRLIARMFNGRR